MRAVIVRKLLFLWMFGHDGYLNIMDIWTTCIFGHNGYSDIMDIQTLWISGHDGSLDIIHRFIFQPSFNICSEVSRFLEIAPWEERERKIKNDEANSTLDTDKVYPLTLTRHDCDIQTSSIHPTSVLVNGPSPQITYQKYNCML